jgi:hypothetical protein
MPNDMRAPYGVMASEGVGSATLAQTLAGESSNLPSSFFNR